MITTVTILVLFSYLLGSVPTGYLIAKHAMGIDIREYGSGNPGAANVYRTVGKWAGITTFLIDGLKGFIPVCLARHYCPESYWVAIACGVIAILGHMWTIYLKFRGGKGVATLVGAVTGIYPPVALLCFGVWLVVLMISHYVSLSSIIAGCCFPIFTLISPKVNESIAFVVFSFATAILLVYTHRKNIQRLWAGTESKIYIWKPRRVKIDDAAKKDDAATRK